MSIPRPENKQLSNLIKDVIDEAKSPWTKYEENEDENMHSHNIVHMAKHVGDADDLKQAKAILARHNKEGYLSDENGNDRSALNKKLWPKFYEKYKPKK